MTQSRTKATSVLSLSVLLVGLLAFGTNPAKAQMGIDFKPGVKAGVNFMTQSGDGVSGLSRRTGVQFGAFAMLDLGIFALQPELIYTQKGAQRKTTRSVGGFGGSASYTEITTNKFGYVEVPILAKLQIPVGGLLTPSIFAGPNVGFNVGATRQTELEGVPNFLSGALPNTGEQSIDNAKTVEFGLTFGAGATVGVGAGSVMLDFRYGLGLTSAYEGSNSITNQGFMVTAGYAF